MKLKSLHTKNNFLRFLFLAILVLGGSVGVILATQEQIFDEPKAEGRCNLDCSSKSIGTEMCRDNKIYTCVKNSRGKYFFDLAKKCSSGYACVLERSGAEYCDFGCTLDNSNDCNLEGETRCSGTDMLQRCTDGVWQDYKQCSIWGQACITGYFGSKCFKLPPVSSPTPKPTIKPTPKPTIKPSSTTTPKPTTGPCSYSCVAEIECKENGGEIIQGYCSSGLKCCDW